MTFDNNSILEIPQLATDLTTEELKQICGGHQGQKQNIKHKKNKGKKKHQKHQENKDNNNNNDDY
ncbi:MAG TPA: hypothetical protein VGL94_20835 [Ktedonobacteraceae bacterium]|jgi:hypothetical protein